MKKKNFKKGIMLVEILIGVFIFSILLGILININNLYVTSVSSSLKSIKALYLAEEGVEAVRIIRDKSWIDFQNLIIGQNYYLNFSTEASSAWKATTTLSYKKIDNIDRWFVLGSVNRSYGKIVESGGTLDPDTKKIDIFVSWQDRGKTITKSISTYLTKINSN